MRPMRHLHLDPSKRIPLLREQRSVEDAPRERPAASKTHTSPSSISDAKPNAKPEEGQGHEERERGEGDASVYFIGNATTIIEWQGLRILTDPNFLHAGDHVHLGPGVTAQRLKNPAVEIDELPPVDLVLLSHYHEDHFDRLVEERLSRDLVVVTTPHAKGCLASSSAEGGPFRAVYDIDTFESLMLHVNGPKQVRADRSGKVPTMKITAMPGKHVPPGPLAAANNLLGAVPPTNGWLLEMAWSTSEGTAEMEPHSIDPGYRIYISGDTLFVDELKEIPKFIQEQQKLAQNRHPHSDAHPSARDGEDARIDLMIVHLGGTTIPGPHMPLLMVTMDARQGVKLMRLLNPDLTIPIHFDDYSVMLSPLGDFKTEVANMGEAWRDRVVYLERGEQFKFMVRESS
ncbi:Metallo-hydrolase/oxidoreductase [Xylaria sp. FL1042]|nr:Metallo-hydrolase/oxidoreductase [Xylaria sp. FL1042]